MTQYLINIDANGNITGSEVSTPPIPPINPSPLPPPTGYTTKVFSDYFPGTVLDGTKWWNGMADQRYGPWRDNGKLPPPYTAAGNSGGNNLEFMDPANISVNNGLTITTKRDNRFPQYSWSSGSICTYNRFKFTGGLLRIQLQQAPGHGMWNGLWMLDQGGGNEIDVQEGGYLPVATYNQMLALNLHEPGFTQQQLNSQVDLTTSPHLYELAYVPGQSLSWFFNGQRTYQTTTNVPTGQYELIINNQVASPQTSNWHTTVDSTTPSPTQSHITAVEVWQ